MLGGNSGISARIYLAEGIACAKVRNSGKGVIFGEVYVEGEAQ